MCVKTINTASTRWSYGLVLFAFCFVSILSCTKFVNDQIKAHSFVLDFLLRLSDRVSGQWKELRNGNFQLISTICECSSAATCTHTCVSLCSYVCSLVAWRWKRFDAVRALLSVEKGKFRAEEMKMRYRKMIPSGKMAAQIRSAFFAVRRRCLVCF